MRRIRTKRAGKSDASADNGASSSAKHGAENAAIASADFMLSIVEAHHTRGNGNVIKMDSGLKAQQELEKIEQQITQAADAGRAERGNAPPDPAIARAGQRPSPRDFFAPERMGAHGTGASSAASLHAGLCRAHFYRLERDSRGSQLPRRSGDCLRNGSFSRRGSHRDRPAEGARRETARVSQLWHGAPGRISEGAAGDEDCGEVQASDFDVRRYRWRVSRTARRRARTGRSDRAEPARDGAPGSAHHCDRDWRRRQWRSAGDCRGRPRVDDGKCRILGDFAGGLRLDHVARYQQEAAWRRRP